MHALINFPLLVFVLSFAVLWLAAQVGVFFRKRFRTLEADEYSDLGTVVAATLTLLGLFIAFSFSMAISRYDQRKNYEAEEANAIGTEYVRLSLLPGDEKTKAQDLLNRYLRCRIAFYENPGIGQQALQQLGGETSRLEAEMWNIVYNSAGKYPTAPMALVVSGMNEVLNARSYTQAAWWNRIPVAAWTLMGCIAIFCNFLIGFGAHRSGVLLFLVLPLALSISFSLVADIDSPRGGMIRVLPRNLISLSQSINGGMAQGHFPMEPANSVFAILAFPVTRLIPLLAPASFDSEVRS
jgi:hypothetical protein